MKPSAALAALALALALALAGCSLPRPYGRDVTLHAQLLGGYRAVDDEVFEGHAAYGLEFVTRDARSGWGYEASGSYGAEDAGGPRDHEAEFDEYSLGLRRSWQPADSAARPYVAFGGSYARIEHRLDSPSSDFDADGGAAYVHGGVLWDLGRYDIDRGTEFLLGLDVRGVLGDDYDYVQLALVLGFGR